LEGAETFTGAKTFSGGTNSATPTTLATLINATAAIEGTQSASPSVIQTGQGWKTTATAASQSVSFRQFVLPVQGTTAPTGNWKLQSDIAGGGYSDRMTVTSAGALLMSGSGTSAEVALSIGGNASCGFFTTGSGTNITVCFSGAGRFQFDNTVGLSPTTVVTNIYPLGTSTAKWGSLYVGSAAASTIEGALNLSSTLAVTGATTLTGLLTANGGITLGDAQNIAFNTTTGTKIGTATTQKIGFWNATPVVQQSAVADASGGVVIDAEARTALNSLLAKLRTLGIIAT
jgi:hypothetical protein